MGTEGLERYHKARKIIAEQEEDGALWVDPETEREAVMLRALVRLHEAIEGWGT